MFKKLIPLALVALLGACTTTEANTTNAGMNKSCCEKCECCKSGKCKMCMGKMDGMSADQQCPMCEKAEREWRAKQNLKKK